MNKKIMLSILLLLVIFIGGCADEVGTEPLTTEVATETVEQTTSRMVADDFVNKLLSGDFTSAHALLDGQMKQAIFSAFVLRLAWGELTSSMGEYVSHGEPRVVVGEGVDVYLYPASFEKGNLLVQIAIIDNLVAGLYVEEVLNNNELGNSNPPAPSDDLPEGVLEKDIIINKGTDIELYGKLTYPANAVYPIPVVVLVHGSGPQDMDETIGPNKPFKDIAYGLSKLGIAVLRYNKITYTHPSYITESNLSVDLETVNDAVAAKVALLEQSGLEFSKMYVAGHSQGGMMAPRIASFADYDGMIIMAGTTRDLIDISRDQNYYFYSDSVSANILAEFENEYARAKEWISLPFEQITDSMTFGGLPIRYFKGMVYPSAEDYMKELDIPTLIIQGSKDFQVYADIDFVRYKGIVESLSDAKMILYEGLNHMFMKSTMEKPDISEYLIPANVDEQVIKDIANWILAH